MGRGVPRGYTIVEVLVALAILQVGVGAAAATLLLAARTLARAEATERATADASAVADSLLEAGDSVPGVIVTPMYELRWKREGAGWRVTARSPDRVLVDVTIPPGVP